MPDSTEIQPDLDRFTNLSGFSKIPGSQKQMKQFLMVFHFAILH